MIGVDFSKLSRPSFAAKPAIAATPTPHRGKAAKRRLAMVKDAQALLPFLPEAEGDTTTAIVSGRADLAVMLAVILEHYGVRCQALRIATLSYNARNIAELAALLESKRVESLTLLASVFFQRHNREVYAEAKRRAGDFPGRWRSAASRNHAKVICAQLGDRRLVLHGSANLRSNGNAEQVEVTFDAPLHDYFAAWIDAQVNEHERDDSDDTRADRNAAAEA